MLKISVIVPIYNVEKYIEDCVNSVITQTYTNYELILVNDASPDNSLELIKKLAEND
uniref:glycosyltransferase family 2 protein n=2 Tax=Streptococcus TaxID=1301 RepID=UPI0012905D10